MSAEKYYKNLTPKHHSSECCSTIVIADAHNVDGSRPYWGAGHVLIFGAPDFMKTRTAAACHIPPTKGSKLHVSITPTSSSIDASLQKVLIGSYKAQQLTKQRRRWCNLIGAAMTSGFRSMMKLTSCWKRRRTRRRLERSWKRSYR